MNPVWFYKANIVDYIRLALLLSAFLVSQCSPFLFVFFYGSSQLMDMLDGHLARKYDQCSKFGAVLDMVLDRASNSMFFVLLGTLYPRWAFVFGALALLDLCSHWTVMYSAVLLGKHHKERKNPLLRFYYRPLVLASLCAGNEGTWMSLFLIASLPGSSSTAACAFTSVIVTVSYVLLAVCAPMSALKQVISVVQWAEACNDLAELDMAEKALAKKSK